MGNLQAKPSEKLQYIDKEVSSIRSSLRGSKRNIPKELQDKIVQNLASYSSEANALRGKVKEKQLNATQKNISDTMNEILVTSTRESQLDQAALETNSFIQMPLNKRHSTTRTISEIPPKKQKSNALMKQNAPTLHDIEYKFKTLKPLIIVAIDNKDNTQLRVHKQTIKVLATDLEMIDIAENTHLNDRKEKLISTLTFYYQKLNKTMKELQRTRDINYLSNQSKKEQVMKELDEIKRNLEETDSQLKQAIKTDNAESISTCQNDLVKLNQRLTSVEFVDEASKLVKMQMIDKISWLYKYINESTKKGSHSDLTKAQSNYEDLIKNIASGQNRNKEDIKIKLQSLQSYISNIEDEDEENLKRKRQLLNNIHESFSSLVENQQAQNKTSDTTDIAAQRKKSVINILKEVEDFESACERLRTILQAVKLSSKDVQKVDKILEQIQISIGHMRNTILSKSKTKLSKNFNNSTPNLSSTKAVQSKFGSSLSVDNSNGSLIKTRAKVYNLAIPQVRTVSSQPVVLKEKATYRQDDNGFSKIEEIRTQVNYIKEKFEKLCEEEHVKNKLESYKEVLESFVNHTNQTTANNARAVISDVQEMIRKICEAEKSKNEFKSGGTVDIKNNLDHFQKSVDSFYGTKSDESYLKLKRDLVNTKTNLDYNNTLPLHEKESILNRIQSLLNILERNGTIGENLSNLKSKVNRFSGAYKGVLYNTIEKDLNKLLTDTSKSIDNTQLADQITEEAKKHLKILEQKATKDQSFRRTLNTTHKTLESEKLAKLRVEVDTIRNNIKTTPSSGINLFLDLKTRLDLVSLGLDPINNLDDDVMQQKSVLGNEVETLKNVVEGKISVARQSIQYTVKEHVKEDALRNSEEQFNKLKTDIENFVGTKSDNKYYELDEYSIRLILRLDDMQPPKGSSAHEKKIELLKQIYQCGDILEKRAQETETLIKYERDINDIEINFEKSTNLSKLADRVSELKTNLLSNEFNTLLTGRKQSCIKKLDDISSKIATKINEKDNSEKLLELENELNTIKTGIDEFSGIHTDGKYNELESSSKSLHSKLDNFQFPTGTKLNERKQELMNKIHSYGTLLDKNAKETEILTKFEGDVNDIEANFERHTNLSNDVLKFAERVCDLKTKLQSNEFNTSLSSRKQICIKTLDDIMNKITEIINKTKDSENLSKLEKEFDAVKIGIDEFSGIHTDRKFYELDGSITSLYSQLDNLQFPTGTKLYERKYALLKEMHSYGKILNRKAKETETFREIVNKIDEIHSRLVKSKDDKDKLKIIEAELKSVKSKIGNSNLSENLKKAVGQEYDTIMERFLPLQKAVESSKSNYIGSDAFLADLDKNKSKAPEKIQNNLESQFNAIEKELAQLKENIASFTNTDASEEYQHLEDAILKANVKLKQLDVPKEDHVLFRKKFDLKQIALDCLTDLDEKVQEVENIIDIEKMLENIGKKLGTAMNEEGINALDEELIALQVKMGKISVSSNLSERKNKCIKTIHGYMKKLKEFKSNSNSEEDNSGTFV